MHFDQYPACERIAGRTHSVNHRVDGVDEPKDFSVRFDRDLLTEISTSDGGLSGGETSATSEAQRERAKAHGGFGDGSHLVGEIAGHLVDLDQTISSCDEPRRRKVPTESTRDFHSPDTAKRKQTSAAPPPFPPQATHHSPCVTKLISTHP